MSAAMVLDVFVALLLIATITYAVILNRKLSRLRVDRSAFEKMLKKFVDATARAESGVAHLQRVADSSAVELDTKRSSTLALRDDLEFLVSRAEQQADRLDKLIADGREQEIPRGRVEAPEVRSDDAPASKPFRGATGPSYLFEDTAAEDPIAPDEEPFDDTPAWLASARKLANVGEELR